MKYVISKSITFDKRFGMVMTNGRKDKKTSQEDTIKRYALEKVMIMCGEKV